MPSDKYVDPYYAKTEQYLRDLAEIQKEGVCPFCPEHFNWHPNPTLHRDGGWFVTESGQPYENAQLHLLLIREKHAESVFELTPEDWLALGRLNQWAAHKYNLTGGGIAMRWGEKALTGASVSHIHSHIIVPKLNPKTGRADYVSFPIG